MQLPRVQCAAHFSANHGVMSQNQHFRLAAVRIAESVCPIRKFSALWRWQCLLSFSNLRRNLER